jgi:FkbM family methyltransferase
MNLSYVLSGVRQVSLATQRHELARHHQIKSLSRFVRLQVATRLLQRSIVIQFINNVKLIVSYGMTGANGNYYWGLHEYNDMAFTIHYMRQNDLFIDVGANIGSYTVLASGVSRARTICFEPVPATIERLRANIAVNELGALVEVRQLCIGSIKSTVKFTTNFDTTNRIADGDEASIEVPMSKLDDELRDCDPVLIKIDAEGFDNDVVRGASSLLSRSFPCAIIIETVSAETHRVLEGYGFQLCHYDPRLRRILPERSVDGNNKLYIRDLSFASMRVSTAPVFNTNGFGNI